MDKKPLLFPQTLHYTCNACAACCRSLEAVATPDEVAKFKDFDWAATRERFRDREAMRLGPEGLFHLNHLDGACIFLDEDELCAIHKELGFEQKPFMCKHFPLHLTDVPEGVIVSYDFSCDAVIRDEGAPIQNEEETVYTRMAEWERVGPELVKGMVSGSAGGQTPNIAVRLGVPLAWPDYLALEDGLCSLLAADKYPLTRRLLLLDRLVQESTAHAAPGAMGPWVAGLAANAWGALDELAGPPPPMSPLRQRAVLAPAIGSIEASWNQRFGGATTAGSRVSLALAVVPARKTLRLDTADAMIDLAQMPRVRFAQDDPALMAPVERFLTAFIRRKGLVSGTSVLQGSRYLALYVGALRWYAVARAAIAGRDAVTPIDVQHALQIVEKTLSRSPSLREPRFASLMNLMFQRVASPASLYVNPYPS